MTKRPRDKKGRFVKLFPKWIQNRLRFTESEQPLLLTHKVGEAEKGIRRSKR